MKWFSHIKNWGPALCFCLIVGPAHAFCGFYAGKADASLFNEASQVVVARDGNRTVLSMLNDYNGPLSDFVLVVPTPVPLKQGQVRIADKAVFEHLDAYSSPRLAEYNDDDPCRVDFSWGQNIYPAAPMAYSADGMVAMKARSETRDRALGVTVEARYTLEEYDIVSLSAKQSDGLETWLRENGYKIPKGASEALKPYINQGMKFFVAKVNLKEQMKTGYSTLRPLQFAFESEKFMLPMRLGMLNAPPGKAQDLIVYLMTRNGRVESSNYRTAKLPANVNLPDFVKPKFQDFYKAMFDKAARTEDYRVAFTEYFWNMGWCDPCAAQPLSREELMKAGVFWLDGDVGQNFNAMQNSAGSPVPMSRVVGGQAQPVMLTRLHVRYTPRTFPEDLMFTQTRDSENWQARYVIQNPYGGSVSECTARVGQMNCESMCGSRISQVREWLNHGDPQSLPPTYQSRKPPALWDECMAACKASKAQGVEAAVRYYRNELPRRIAHEKQTLAQLTGWTLHDIDAMPGADRYALAYPNSSSLVDGAAPAEPSWWQKFFAQ
ncbi:MAG TPA: DUF2330 domain-containing protein [Burkholderiaceae bacterium]|jgi:hypothetical protein